MTLVVSVTSAEASIPSSFVPSVATSRPSTVPETTMLPVTSRGAVGAVLLIPTFPSWRTVIASTSVPVWLSMKSAKELLLPEREPMYFMVKPCVSDPPVPALALKIPKSALERLPVVTIALPLVLLSLIWPGMETSPLPSRNTAFSAGCVQKISRVPADQSTALSLLLDCRMVVRARVVPLDVYVPTPTSKSEPSVQQ